MVIAALYLAGIGLLLIALDLFCVRPVNRALVTQRDVSNFSGDVAAWVRSSE